MEINKYKTVVLLIFIAGLFNQLFAQIEKSDFSKIINNSEVIIYAKVKGTTSKWVDDKRGKHIYTYADLDVLETVKGNLSQNNIQLEIIGGTVGNITETVSESFTARKDDELVLFLRQNPLRVIYGNQGVIYTYNEKIFLENSLVPVGEFLEVISEISKNEIEIKNIREIEKTILQKRIKSNLSPLDSVSRNLLNKNDNKNKITVVSDLPNLIPYKPSTWSDIIVFKRTGINSPDDTPQFTEDSPIFDSDELFLALAFVNGGNASAGGFNVKIYVDNLEVISRNYQGLDAGYYYDLFNISIGSLSVGSHLIKMILDEENKIKESNENDNTYTRIINVQHISGTPLITSISPSIASAGTGSRITITGSGFGVTRGTSVVEFFVQDGGPKIQPKTYFSWSNDQIVCDVPTGNVGGYDKSASSGPVTITTSTGKSNGFNFNVSYGYGGIKWKGDFPKVYYKINENLQGVMGEGAAIQSAMNTWS